MIGLKLSNPLMVHRVYCGESVRGIVVIFSMRTQPGGEVTSVVFVSMALQPDLEMTNSTDAGGVQLSGKINPQMHTGVLHSATTHSHTQPWMQIYIAPYIQINRAYVHKHVSKSKWVWGSLRADRCTRGPEEKVWQWHVWCMTHIRRVTKGHAWRNTGNNAKWQMRRKMTTLLWSDKELVVHGKGKLSSGGPFSLWDRSMAENGICLSSSNTAWIISARTQYTVKQ